MWPPWIRQWCVRCCSTSSWNSLPDNVRDSQSYSNFCPNLKLTILTLHFITISSVSCTIQPVFYFVRRLWATDEGDIANPNDMIWWYMIRNCSIYCLYLLSVVLQLGTLYQQPFKTYHHHHHPVSAAISKLNYFAGRMASIHRSMFVIA